MKHKVMDILMEGIGCVYTRKTTPGEVVLNMSLDKREALQTLKSEDLQNMRPDVIFGVSLPKKRGRWGI